MSWGGGSQNHFLISKPVLAKLVSKMIPETDNDEINKRTRKEYIILHKAETKSRSLVW